MVTQSSAAQIQTESKMRLLIVEDDRESADYLVKAFREVGHIADHASDGEEGLALAESGDYDVLVIDRMLPKRDGLSIIGTLRAKGNHTPALILSALGQVDDRIKGLRAGGDDYLPKPYSFAELLARVEVLSRRHGGPSEETTYRVGDLELDRAGAASSCCVMAHPLEVLFVDVVKAGRHNTHLLEPAAPVDDGGGGIGPFTLAKNIGYPALVQKCNELADKFGVEVFRPTKTMQEGKIEV